MASLEGRYSVVYPLKNCTSGSQACASTPVSLPRQDGMHLAVAKDEVSLFPGGTIWGLLVADTSRKGRYWQWYSLSGATLLALFEILSSSCGEFPRRLALSATR